MIKPLVLALILASLVVLGGCQKSVDFGRVQEESLGLVKVHIGVVDQLQRRADALLVRGRNVSAKGGPGAQGIADAGRILTEARARLDQLRALTQQFPAALATAAKTGNDEELYKVTDETTEKLENGETLARADLDVVENWLYSAESRPAPATPTPPAAPPATP